MPYKDREKRLEYGRAWTARNRGYAQQHYKDNKPWYKDRDHKRRTRDTAAYTGWDNPEDLMRFYDECPPGDHIDHIIPLTNKMVCGLHTLANLQYLSASENSSKGNTFDVERYPIQGTLFTSS